MKTTVDTAPTKNQVPYLVQSIVTGDVLYVIKDEGHTYVGVMLHSTKRKGEYSEMWAKSAFKKFIGKLTVEQE